MLCFVIVLHDSNNYVESICQRKLEHFAYINTTIPRKPKWAKPIRQKPHTRNSVKSRIRVTKSGKVFVNRIGKRTKRDKKTGSQKRFLRKLKHLKVSQSRRLLKMVHTKGKRYERARRDIGRHYNSLDTAPLKLLGRIASSGTQKDNFQGTVG